MVVLLLGVWLAPYGYAQNITPDKDTDFPSLGEQSSGGQPAATPRPSQPAPTFHIPEVPGTPAAEPDTVSFPAIHLPDVSSIPEPASPQFTSIPSPVLPPFSTIPSPVLPKFSEIASPQLKFTALDEGSKFGNVPELKLPQFTKAEKIKVPSITFTPTEAGGGETPHNNSSTPTPSPQALPSWGQSSTPIAVYTPPSRQTPYVWGQSSTPIAAPLTPNIIQPNIQTPHVWGQSSTPIASPAPLNVVIPNRQTPYVWGASSTPVAVSRALPNWGQSSTPHGTSSTPRGSSSTPTGESSTPHGPSSTPSGPSSTPRAR